MKLLLFWQHYPPEGVGLALSVRGAAMSKFLLADGHEVSVCAPVRIGVRGARGPSGEIVRRVMTYESLRELFPIWLALLIMPFALLWTAVIMARFRPAAIIVSQPSYTLPAQAIVIARLLRARCIVDIQDVFLQDQVFAATSPWKGSKLLMEKLVVNAADRCLVVLPRMRDELIRVHRLDSNRCVVLYNGFDGSRISSSLSGGTKSIDLLHLGSPRAYYDTRRLLSAFARIVELRPQTTLVFTDCRDDEYVRSVRELTHLLGIHDSVSYFEQLSQAELFKLMNQSCLGVFTLYPADSSKVLVGTKVFEYLAAGLPVAHMGYPGGSVQDIISANGAGVVEFDVETFATQVVRVLDDPDLRQRMSANARKASALYDWRVTMPRALREVLSFGMPDLQDSNRTSSGAPEEE